MYDALETELKDSNTNSFRFAENEYFEDAVCLNKEANSSKSNGRSYQIF